MGLRPKGAKKDIEWLIGILDGDSYILNTNRKNKKVVNSIDIKMSNRDLNVLNRVGESYGFPGGRRRRPRNVVE